MTCNDTSVPCRDYNPCRGQSTCRMRDSGFSCDCPPGKVGRYCENGEWKAEVACVLELRIFILL